MRNLSIPTNNGRDFSCRQLSGLAFHQGDGIVGGLDPF
jgi:hypothetical protein